MRLLVILALVGAAIAAPDRTNRIMGGVPTTVEKYPFMASIEGLYWEDRVFYHACGGALISRRSVITAARCFFQGGYLEYRVRLGSSERNAGGTVYDVDVIVHEKYDRPLTFNNDVAVVILWEPAAFTLNVAPIKLAARNYDLPDFATVTVMGWGNLEEDVGPPTQLQEVDLNVIPQEICYERYHELISNDPLLEHWSNINETMVCAGILDIGGKDACHGDIGGPLIHGDVLVGLVSFGMDCGDAHYPRVFTRVSAFAEWIILNVYG